jgi:hypothetical protein
MTDSRHSSGEAEHAKRMKVYELHSAKKAHVGEKHNLAASIL